ncbi:MAG: NAD(P)-dependent oxidoreductase [Candidatus Liptonbacteria bacterium]|nr:NAD(P)-dependent oxidoreductase [Candidatus Liptonbacteria bacterium]
MMSNIQTVLVTGGAGYVGSVLVPKLLKKGYRVKVLDLYLYEPNVFAGYRNSNLEEIHGDIRNDNTLSEALLGVDAVIHLACISNDPSFELNPELGKSINYDAMIKVVSHARQAEVKRFIFASTSSVYGLKQEENITEDLPLEPLTDYSKFKVLGEEILMKEGAPYFTAVAIRSATVCGYSPRMRFDLTVNILTNHAWSKGIITVFGGEQKRPNIHIEDITDLYSDLLSHPSEKIHSKVFNAGARNYTVSEIANIVKSEVESSSGNSVKVNHQEAGDDKRSYHISSEKIFKELGFKPKRDIRGAVSDLIEAFKAGKFEDSLNNTKYFNVKTMQEIKLK